MPSAAKSVSTPVILSDPFAYTRTRTRTRRRTCVHVAHEVLLLREQLDGGAVGLHGAELVGRLDAALDDVRPGAVGVVLDLWVCALRRGLRESADAVLMCLCVARMCVYLYVVYELEGKGSVRICVAAVGMVIR